MKTALTPTGNPQGKGLVGVIDDFHNSTPQKVSAKPLNQWLADYFTSILVLNAECKLKPVIHQSYYLYLKNDSWKLSLIEPTAWSAEVSGIYFAECVLHPDRTWSVTTKKEWQQNEILLATIHKLQSDFLASINNDSPLLEQLPFFAAHLPYYRRISANALARSLRESLSLEKGRDVSQQITGHHLLSNLTNSKTLLLDP